LESILGLKNSGSELSFADSIEGAKDILRSLFSKEALESLNNI
jgi:hypothetical protein